jgi:hypothetical protein
VATLEQFFDRYESWHPSIIAECGRICTRTLACDRPPRQHLWLPYRPGNEQKTTPNGYIFREVDQLPLEGRRTCS